MTVKWRYGPSLPADLPACPEHSAAIVVPSSCHVSNRWWLCLNGTASHRFLATIDRTAPAGEPAGGEASSHSTA